MIGGAGTYAAGVPGAIKRPFWIHQLVEYLLGLALVSLGLQSPHPEVPAAMGLLVIVNAAIVRRAPLSAFRLVTKSQHRVLDVIVIAVLSLGAIQPWFESLTGDRVTIGGVAFIMGFVWMRSSFVDRSRSAAAPVPGPVTPAGGEPVSRPPVGSDRSTEFGRSAGRAVGKGLNAARRFTKRGEGT